MKRADGRRYDKLRNIKVMPGYLKYAEGSCLFEIGNTKVICSASVEEGVPPFLKGRGTGWVSAEYSMLPRSCKTRISRESSRGKVQGRTQEIQRLIGRSMRSVVDMKQLGERTIWLDADVVQGDGGTRCAGITGCFIALVMALDGMRRKNIFTTLPVSGYVAAISLGIVDEEEMLDLSYEEDSRAEVDMNVVMTDKGRVIEIQGTAEREPFSIDRLNSMIRMAKKGIEEIVRLEKKIPGLKIKTK